MSERHRLPVACLLLLVLGIATLIAVTKISVFVPSVSVVKLRCRILK